MFTVVYWIVVAFLLFLAGYGLYKTFWYFVKLMKLAHFLKRVTKERTDLHINFKRTIFSIPFVKYGMPLLEFMIGEKHYELTFLSFPSIRSRWNIEMRNGMAFFEVRRKNRIFYGIDRNSEEPDSAAEYRRELRMIRKPICITPQNEYFDRQFILVYPRPREITRTSQSLEYLSFGEELDGHTLISFEELVKFMNNEK